MVEKTGLEHLCRLFFYYWILIGGLAQSVTAGEDAACESSIDCIEKTSEYIGNSDSTDLHICIDAPCSSPPPSGGKALWVCLVDNPRQENSSFELKVDANNMLDKNSVGRALGFNNGADLYCKHGPSRQDPFSPLGFWPIETECSTSALKGSKKFESEEVHVHLSHNVNFYFHTKHGWGYIENQGLVYRRYSFQCTQATSH